MLRPHANDHVRFRRRARRANRHTQGIRPIRIGPIWIGPVEIGPVEIGPAATPRSDRQGEARARAREVARIGTPSDQPAVAKLNSGKVTRPISVTSAVTPSGDPVG